MVEGDEPPRRQGRQEEAGRFTAEIAEHAEGRLRGAAGREFRGIEGLEINHIELPGYWCLPPGGWGLRRDPGLLACASPPGSRRRDPSHPTIRVATPTPPL